MLPVRRFLVVASLAALPLRAIAASPPVAVSFDASRHAIGLNITVKGAPLFALLDTGVEPSIVDVARATQLGLPMDRAQGSEGSGFGSRKAQAFPATIKGLKIGGRPFGDVEALALDTRAISKGYGRTVDAVLGYSFLKDNAVLIDYRASTVTLLPDAKEAEAATHRCTTHYSIPLVFFGDNHWPVITNFRIGAVTAPVTLDTGSSRLIGFFQTALRSKRIRDALKVTGTNVGASIGGAFTSRTAVLRVPAGFGPFVLSGGQTVSLLPNDGQSDKVVANLGNRGLAQMSAKMLLDYAGGRISFFGDCGR